jgi:hypothetical protein
VSPTLVAETLDWLGGIGVDMSPARVAYLTDGLVTRQGYSPHSAMLDSAIQGGVLVLPFWLVSVVLIARGALRYRGNDAGMALIVLVGGATMWNAFFSPMTVPVYLGLALALFLATDTINASRINKEPTDPDAR